MLLLLAALLQQQQAAPTPQSLPASPVARISISPAKLVVAASDSIRLIAVAYDSNGKVVDRAGIRFSSGAANAGIVDSTGWVIARGTGKITGAVMSVLPGYKPFVHRFEVVVVPDAPARVAMGTVPTKLVVGQRVRASAAVYTRADDRREGDMLRWSSSAPSIARVDDDGIIVAGAPGRAVITAVDAPAS